MKNSSSCVAHHENEEQRKIQDRGAQQIASILFGLGCCRLQVVGAESTREIKINSAEQNSTDQIHETSHMQTEGKQAHGYQHKAINQCLLHRGATICFHHRQHADSGALII